MAEQSDVKRVKRIVKVLGQLHRVEELKLVDAGRRQEETRAKESALAVALHGDVPALLGFIPTIARQLTTASREADAAEISAREQKTVVAAHQRKLKAAEGKLETAETAAERASEARDLGEVIERSVRGDAASVRQAR